MSVSRFSSDPFATMVGHASSPKRETGKSPPDFKTLLAFSVTHGVIAVDHSRAVRASLLPSDIQRSWQANASYDCSSSARRSGARRWNTLDPQKRAFQVLHAHVQSSPWFDTNGAARLHVPASAARLRHQGKLFQSCLSLPCLLPCDQPPILRSRARWPRGGSARHNCRQHPGMQNSGLFKFRLR